MLGLKQNDMMLRVGIYRQQYQRLESRGNPRLKTLELIVKGLNCELMLIPKEQLSAVQAALDSESTDPALSASSSSKENKKKSLSEDPWQGLLGKDSKGDTQMSNGHIDETQCV